MLRTSLFTLKRLMPTKAVSNGLPRVHQPSHTASMAVATSSSIPEKTMSNSLVTNQLFPESMNLASLHHDYKFFLDKPQLDDRLDNQESIVKPTFETPVVFSHSDYLLCLKHEVGDFDAISEELQMKLRDFAENTFIPDVLHYLGTKDPVYRRYSVYQVELHGFEFEFNNLSGVITNEERYDLWRLERFLTLPWGKFSKILGKRLVGSAIRICKTIDKPEHANAFNQMVKGCFKPHEHQDPKDSARNYFHLHVEPSTGGYQCSCCPKKP